MADDVRVETGAVGPVLHPPGHSDLVILYLHGDPEPSLDAPRRLALLTGATTVVCRYRTTFPAALLDVHAAYRYCRHAGRVALVGERMGAGLAAALLVQLRDTGTALPRCAVLLSALLDLTMQAKSVLLNARAEPSLNVTTLRRRIADYAGGAVLTDPLLSPLYANLHGLTPVQLLAAGTDPLLDDSLAFATRASRSGVAVDLRVWPDATSLHAEAVTAMADFIVAWNPEARTTISRMVPPASPGAPSPF